MALGEMGDFGQRILLIGIDRQKLDLLAAIFFIELDQTRHVALGQGTLGPHEHDDDRPAPFAGGQSVRSDALAQCGERDLFSHRRRRRSHGRGPFHWRKGPG